MTVTNDNNINKNDDEILVPRENVYHQELAIIIANLLKNWNVISQFRKDKKQRINCSLIITAPKKPSAMIDILATETKDDLYEHFDRTLEYAQSLDPKLNVREIWVAHFTCQDFITKSPPWPKGEQQEMGLKVAHIWHDINFKTARISARWKDRSDDEPNEILDEELF
jgi:hypothetical protein